MTVVSREQRMGALERANDIRFRRAALKRELRENPLLLAGLLTDPPWWLESMRVFDLLRALPWWGQVKAGRLMRLADVPLNKRVGGLTVRQRERLLRGRAAR